jgi:hypothetical protein
MALLKNIQQFLNRPGKNIAIVGIDEVLTEHESVFEFINEIRHWSDTTWETGLLQRETDDGQDSRIVLAAYPSKIQEAAVTGERIYIVEDTKEIQPALTYYKISS